MSWPKTRTRRSSAMATHCQGADVASPNICSSKNIFLSLCRPRLRKQFELHTLNGDDDGWSERWSRTRKSRHPARSDSRKRRFLLVVAVGKTFFRFVVERANQARIKRLSEAFNVFDQESNNTIPSTELGTVVRSLGLVPTEGELQDILSEVRRKSSRKRFFPSLSFRCPTTRIRNSSISNDS